MNELKSIVTVLCGLGAGGFLCELLLGGTKLKKQVNFMISLFMATSLVGLFGQGIAGFSLPDVPSPEELRADYPEEVYRRQLENESAENICRVLMEQLTAAGLAPEKIEADVNISPDGSISITKVRLTGCGDAGAELVRNSLGCEKEVVELVGNT
ncbi:MAG: hypothetical protein IIZ18_06980 [Ruminococcus sp.]|nr:hypothetical protein [Ruminococcus sp.]